VYASSYKIRVIKSHAVYAMTSERYWWVCVFVVVGVRDWGEG